MRDIIDQLKKVRKEGKNVYICGNGGSASTANHFANDLVKQCRIKAISLCANEAIVMAFGNDNRYENIFSDQLKVFYEDGDLLITISGSGTSKNIVKAQKFVKEFAKKDIKGAYIIFPTMEMLNMDMLRTEDRHLVVSHKIVKELCLN